MGEEEGKQANELWIELLGRHVPAINTPEGIRAVNKATVVRWKMKFDFECTRSFGVLLLFDVRVH